MPEHARTLATMWMRCACVNCVHHSVFFCFKRCNRGHQSTNLASPHLPQARTHHRILHALIVLVYLACMMFAPTLVMRLGGGRTLTTETPLTTRNPSTHCSTRFLMTIHIGLDFIRRCALEQRRTPSERAPRTAQVQGDVRISVGDL